MPFAERQVIRLKFSLKTNQEFSVFWYQILIYLLLSVLPVFVYMMPCYNAFLEDSSNGEEELFLDLFLKGKGYFFCVLAVCFFVSAILSQLKKNQVNFRKFSPELFFLLAYGFFCIISYLLSEHKKLGFNGAVEQNETILVLLGYCMITYSFFILLQKYDLTTTICRALGIGCVLLIVISLFQLFSHDLLQYSWVQVLVIPSRFRENASQIILQSDVNTYNRVYATLYNPNYFGVYGTLIFPILFYSFFHERQKCFRFLFAISIPLLFLLLLASGSKTFLLVFIIQMVLFCFFLFWQGKKYLFPTILTVIVLGAVFLIHNAFSGNLFQNWSKSIFQASPEKAQLEDIQIQKDGVFIIYGDHTLQLSFRIKESGGTIQVLDQNGREFEHQINNKGQYCLQESDLSHLYFYAGRLKEKYICVAVIDDIPWYFTYIEQEDRYAFLTPDGKEKMISKAKNILPGFERIASGRGYIWGRSIPLLKENLLIGQGPETFMLQFPQNDYISAANAGYYNMIVSRPHSAYLQIGIQTGGISFLFYVLTFIFYFIRTLIQLFQKKRFQKAEWIKVSILLSLIGYMICMLAHDSLVVTAPIYWTLLGCGMSLNLNIVKA